MPMRFFTELKRRNVYKVAVAYAVVGWLLIQVATQVFPFFEIPNWAVRLVVLVIIVGFPIALVISWAFELTPEGLKRADETEPSLPSSRSHLWIYVVLVAAALSLGLFFLGRYTVPHEEKLSLTKSIAVLPFESLSEDKGNAYFAAGIQDEILARLSKIADLKVISRTSTQKYKSAPDNLREIAQQLGVSHILEGSVQKSGDQVRITVQLINASADSHLWAETYDRRLLDVFSVESDVAQKIASSLESQLTGREKKEIAVAGTKNAEAYDAFLHALALAHSESADDTEQARKLLRRAVEIDPAYAQAWAYLAGYEANWYFGFEHTEEQLLRARTAAETALRLAPDQAEAHYAMGQFYYYCLQDFERALVELEIAHERAPNDGDTLLAIALVKRRQGKLEESITRQEQAARLDPLNQQIWINLGTSYRGARKFDQARAMYDHALAIAPGNIDITADKAETYLAEGDLDGAEQVLAKVKIAPHNAAYSTQVVPLIYRREFDQALAKISLDIAREKTLPPIITAISHAILGRLQNWKGDPAQARPLLLQAKGEFRTLREQGQTIPFLTALLLEAEAGLGEREEVKREAKAYLKNSANDAWAFPGAEETVARAYAVMGDADRALPLLEHVLSVPYAFSLTPAYLRLDPVWDPIRSDPRFQKLATDHR